MSFVEWLAQPAGRMLTLTLFHFLWQGVLVVLSLVAVVKICGIQRTSTRYACSLAALVAMAAFPIVTLAWISLGSDRASLSQSLILADSPTLLMDLATPSDATLFSISPRSAETLQPYALAVWLGGVLFFGSRLLAGSIGIAKLRRGRLPLPAELAARVERLGLRLQMDALPLVFLSKDVTDAMALGLVRRLVLIPAAWATKMPLEMFEAVIAHELAHLKRMDLWANLLQRIMETLFFYHPAVWWLSHRLGIERELCSDELAVAATGDRLVYAQTLEHIAIGRQADIRPALAAFLRGESNMRLLQRIRNVLAPSPGERRHWPAGLVALGLAVCLWILSVMMMDTLTLSAYADEPTQENSNTDEDYQSDEASEENADTDNEAESADADIIERKVAEALEKVLIEIELKNTKPDVGVDLKNTKPNIDVEKLKKTKTDKASLKIAEKLDKSRSRHEQQMAERKTALMQDLEKLKEAGLVDEHLEAHKKAFLQEMEKLKAAQLHNGLDAEANKALLQHVKELEKAHLQHGLAAEAHRKALLEGVKQFEQSQLQAAQLAAQAQQEALAQSAEQRKQARLQEDVANEQLHHVHLEKEAMEKAMHQRANDERIEKLTAMVQELAGQVERLQRDLSVLREQHEGEQTRDQDGDEEVNARKK